MRNEHGYTHIGGQLKAPRRIVAKLAQLTAQMINDPDNHGVQAMVRKAGVSPALAAGYEAHNNVSQDNIYAQFASRWSDTQLAALVADVRKQEEGCVSRFVAMDFAKLEERCVMDEVQSVVAKHLPKNKGVPIETVYEALNIQWPFVTPPVHPYKISVPVADIRQGDKVFMTGDATPRTVLYTHASDHFVSLVIISHSDALPFMIHRHVGAVIYKEV